MIDTFEKVFGKNTAFKKLIAEKIVKSRPFNSFISENHPSENTDKSNLQLSESHPTGNKSSENGSIEVKSKKRKFTDS